MKHQVVLSACAALIVHALSLSLTPAFAAPAQPTAPVTTQRPATSTSAAGSTSAPRAGTTTTTPAATNNASAAPATVPSVAITGIAVAADVGPDQIKMADLNRLVDGVVQQYPKLAENTPEAQKALKELRDDRLDNMIAQQLLYQEAVKRNLIPTKIQVDREVVRFYDAMQFRSEAEYQKWLTEQGKTEADLRATISKRLAVELLKSQLADEAKVTDADLLQFYNENKSTLFTIPESVVARQIQFSYPQNPKRDPKNFQPLPPTDDDKAKTKTKAQAVLKKALAANADFAALAKENSDDEVSKNRGGVVDVPEIDGHYQITGFRLLSRDDKDNVDPAFFKALFDQAPVGKVYPQLVESSKGFHIIKVEERKPGRTLSYDEAVKAPLGEDSAGHAVTMSALVQQEKGQKRINAKVEELRNTVKVVSYLPK
jgi:hypothetical protein